ncbi:MAG: FAD-dependent oxidoreductase [Deltaproteobacteria bacterium]|nr:FAD-dependent oxidoreductase [Deltaproteobacteria bacterium]
MFDFVVVGAGSAGCVLAARLSADGRRVCLIEAGGPHHRTFKVRAPGMYYTLWKSPLDWGFSTEPQVHCDGRRHYWPRGKLLGGTSCLNTNIYIRGHRTNYDAWGDGWRYNDVLPLFKRSEDNERGASEYHGAGGPLAVDDPDVPPIASSFVEATVARCRVPVNNDFNGAEQEGAGPYQLTVRNGHRASTATAFLDPARTRANLEVIIDAVVTSLIVDGDRVTGVKLGDDRVIEAREVIVAAGAIGSPQLLLRSGIGAADELREAGIDPRHELPLVGKHLQDHLLASVVHACPTTRKLSIPSLLWWSLQHRVGGKGVLGQAPVPVGAFVRSTPEQPVPDVQFHFSQFGIHVPTDNGVKLRFGRFISILPGLIYPRSHGEVTLRGIDPKYLSAPADLDHLVAGVKLAREIAATAPLAQLVGPEVFPGPGVRTDDDLRANIRATCNTIFHPVGTCGIGRVVDADLRVRGLRGLRVADASVMPEIIGGNTNAPTIMIAEKCAELALAG